MASFIALRRLLGVVPANALAPSSNELNNNSTNRYLQSKRRIMFVQYYNGRRNHTCFCIEPWGSSYPNDFVVHEGGGVYAHAQIDKPL